ncbi:spermatogenesis associated 2-like [Danio aesculapii]|uniref:spermatogenesis associated 2-like n=1 Tax=Danio aesculapii TaxID=1142201 RepID=UPI0024C04D21|nr:spermatogenesis associated 2-like [Danio aesculapii]
MSSFAHKKTEDGLTNKYHYNLKRQIEKGDQFLVCRNEDLCKETQALLRNANGQKIHNLFRLDTLMVMDKSLRSFHSKSGQKGLEKLFKAFEVLELAALNLYIYPWRREYRLVKMFSGMFTHLIKPTLTPQQAKELFGLLGYEPSSNNQEEELALNSKPVPADFLLSLACGFFVARMECQLLLSASGSVNRDVEWVLQLIKERQVGHSLQLALENTNVKSEAARASDDIVTGGIDNEVDLYTAQDASHGTSSSCSPPHSPYSKSFRRDPSQSDIGNNDDAMWRRSLSINNPGPVESIGEDQSESDAQRRAAKVPCKCITPNAFYIYECEQCKDIHSSSCSHHKECTIKGHTCVLSKYKVEDLNLTQAQPKPSREKSKDSMKTHSCVAGSTSKSFLVCYDCQFIHDHNCDYIKKCSMNHNVQPTGQLHLPQEDRAKAPNQHTCLTAKTVIYAICHTCNYVHDCKCEYLQICMKYVHHVEYSKEMGDSETTCAPIPYHPGCWKGNHRVPEIICLTCKVFHFPLCHDGQQCSKLHNIQVVGTECVICHSCELFTFCRYCGAPHCKLCFYKNTLLCRCGKSLVSCSAV